MILWGWWCNLRQKQNKVINVGKKWSRNSSNICTLCLVSTWTVLSQPMADSSTPAVPCCSLGTASCSTRQLQWGWTSCSMERGKKCASAWICESCCYLCEHRELSFCSGGAPGDTAQLAVGAWGAVHIMVLVSCEDFFSRRVGCKNTAGYESWKWLSISKKKIIKKSEQLWFCSPEVRKSVP